MQMPQMNEKTAISQGSRQRFQGISCTCILRNKLHKSDDPTKMTLTKYTLNTEKEEGVISMTEQNLIKTSLKLVLS